MSAIKKGFMILEILLKNSSVKHPLSVKDIQELLLKKYGVKMNRRSIKKVVNELSMMIGIAEDEDGKIFAI